MVLDIGRSGGGSDIRLGVGALERFQKRVDALLAELQGSAAGASEVVGQTISRSSLGGANLPFAEADGVYSQYNRFHKELVSLSKSLGDQIELLKIAVHGSQVGYENLEEELRERYHAVQARIAQERERAQSDKDAAPAQPRNDDSSGTYGLGDS
jgi:hypothetical protein